MSLFKAVFGKKNAAMMCCFGIAKPMIEAAAKSTTALAKYRELIKND